VCITIARSCRRCRPAAPPNCATQGSASARLRAPSLIITVWGDAIAPHGGSVMLPGLFRLLAPFGLNERRVRTSIFRLAREGWLEGTPVGRRSLYRLTRDGAHRFEQAYRRIYAAPEAQWDDSWELVLLDGLTAAERRRLREELGWEGYGSVAAGVLAHPSRLRSPVPQVAAALGLARRIVTVRAHDDAKLGGASLAAMAPRAWRIAALAAEYRGFLRRFGGVIDRFRDTVGSTHDPEQSFIVRTLLIHAFRRVLLRDPQLPAALLPLDWPGAAAYALCRDFYRLTHRSAERHLMAMLEGPGGRLPPANSVFYRRFGGLERTRVR
jgi:phenylacetic acid degradation operon negative regulatory protein